MTKPSEFYAVDVPLSAFHPRYKAYDFTLKAEKGPR